MGYAVLILMATAWIGIGVYLVYKQLWKFDLPYWWLALMVIMWPIAAMAQGLAELVLAIRRKDDV